MSEDKTVEMYVNGLVLDPNTQAPVVVLKDESGNLQLPIWIGIPEATSIASAIKDIDMARPLTHDLMQNIFNEINLKVERVLITDLVDSTYYAELYLAEGDRVFMIDSRPSDAIAIALRSSAPIIVSEDVLKKAQSVFAEHNAKQAKNVEEKGSEGEASENEEGQGEEEQNFSEIDKEKWNEILADLDPDDFKYKM
jgi:bifunctional DNase/RNase